MLSFQYMNDTNTYNVSFEKLNKNHVKIIGDIPIKTNGFVIGRIGEPEAFTGDYSDYTTVYKEIDGGIIFSNDGSVYVEPIPVINFRTNGGGVLDGVVMQEVNTYEDLIVPTPIPNENYEFSYWSPEIPESGKIEYSSTFTAIFTSTLPEPEVDDNLVARVETLEDDMKKLNEKLGGVE